MRLVWNKQCLKGMFRFFSLEFDDSPEPMQFMCEHVPSQFWFTCNEQNDSSSPEPYDYRLMFNEADVYSVLLTETFLPVPPQWTTVIALECVHTSVLFNGKNVLIGADVLVLHSQGRQEDAEEYLGFTLNGLHEEMLALKKLISPQEESKHPLPRLH